MKPIFATTKNSSECLRACVASILEVPLEIVPNLGDGINNPREQLIRISKFLRIYNLDIVQYTANSNDSMDKFYFNKTGYYIGRISCYSGHQQSVVMNNNRIVHNPERGSHILLEEPSKYIIFYNLNASIVRANTIPGE